MLGGFKLCLWHLKYHLRQWYGLVQFNIIFFLFSSNYFIYWINAYFHISEEFVRYQGSNLHIEEEQITQWPKIKRTKGERMIYKTNDWVTRTPLKTGVELSISGRVSNSCSTSDTHRVNLVTNPVKSHEWGKDR